MGICVGSETCACLSFVQRPAITNGRGSGSIAYAKCATGEVRIQRNKKRILEIESDVLLDAAALFTSKARSSTASDDDVAPCRPENMTEDVAMLLSDCLLQNENLAPYMRGLNPVALGNIVHTGVEIGVVADQVVFREGDRDPTQFFYIVTEGTISLYKGAEHICDRGKGGSFGELALLYRSPRALTAQALTDGTLWAYERGVLKFAWRDTHRTNMAKYKKALEGVDLFQNAPEIIEDIADSLCEMRVPKDEYLFHQGDSLKSFWLLFEGEVVIEVDGRETETLVGDPEQGIFPELGKRHLHDHEPRQMSAKVASEHSVVLALDHTEFLRYCHKIQHMDRARPGRKKNAREYWRIARIAVMAAIAQKKTAFEEMMSTVELFRMLPDALRKCLANHLHMLEFYEGEYIFKAGDEGDCVYVLYNGLLSVVDKNQCEVSRMIGDPSMGTAPTFGTRAVKFCRTRSTSVRVISPKATVLSLQKEYFLQIDEIAGVHLGRVNSVPEEPCSPCSPTSPPKRSNLARSGTLQATTLRPGARVRVVSTQLKDYNGKVGELLNFLEGSQRWAVKFDDGSQLHVPPSDLMLEGTPTSNLSLATTKSSIGSGLDVYGDLIKYEFSELQVLGLLGAGSFGAVSLVRHQPSTQTLALKKLSKGFIEKQKLQESVMNEKNALKLLSTPWVVRLVATFNSGEFLYFLMELVLGGNLHNAYEQELVEYGSGIHARFYAACILRGLIVLHSRQLVYRDLKPENLMLGNNGYAKLTDFGLAKLVTGRTETLCGTPDYMAPEILAGQGYNRAVDWWALGIAIFEMMMGATPFDSDNPEMIFRKIKIGIKIVHFPSQDAWTDLVKKLCAEEPRDRLTMRPRGHKNVEDHMWFANDGSLPIFNWRELNKRTMPAPYVPLIEHAEDRQNFCEEEDDAPFSLREKSWRRSTWDKDFADPWGPSVLEDY